MKNDMKQNNQEHVEENKSLVDDKNLADVSGGFYNAITAKCPKCGSSYFYIGDSGFLRCDNCDHCWKL